MGTRATIGVERADGTIQAIYCGHDGYLDHAGEVLVKHYKDPAKIDALMALGDLSGIYPELGGATIEEREAMEAAGQKCCVAYARDRGENDPTAAETFASVDEFVSASKERDAEYVYLHKCGRWLVSQGRSKFYPVPGQGLPGMPATVTLDGVLFSTLLDDLRRMADGEILDDQAWARETIASFPAELTA